MTERRDTLQQALTELEEGQLTGVSTIVVNRGWWEALSADEQDGYHRRCARRGVELCADDRLSRHFVEAVSGRDGPPLSTERQV